MISQVTIPELVAALDAGDARVIDVREQWEFAQGHVAGATWIPMALVPLRVEEYRGGSPAYIICRTGNRSGQVVMWLARQGIEAINVHGGIVAWEQQGLPVTRGNEALGVQA